MLTLGAQDFLVKERLTANMLLLGLQNLFKHRPIAGASGGEPGGPFDGSAEPGWIVRVGRPALEGTRSMEKRTDAALLRSEQHILDPRRAWNGGRRNPFGGDGQSLSSNLPGPRIFGGRLGENEFAILAVGAPAATAPLLVARLEKGVQAHQAEGETLSGLSLSVGLAHTDAQHPCWFEELLHRADNQLRIQPLIISQPPN